jgi:hypothetical protein
MGEESIEVYEVPVSFPGVGEQLVYVGHTEVDPLQAGVAPRCHITPLRPHVETLYRV